MLLYAQDKGGDENWHLYRTDLTTNRTVDLTPFHGVKAGFCASDKNYPDDILITMNKKNKKLFDIYHLNLITGALELREKNPGNIKKWIVDSNLQIRAALQFTQEELSLLLRATEKDPWETVMSWNFEDVMTVDVPVVTLDVFCFSRDGNKLYLKDPTDSDTVRLIEYDCTTGSRTVLADDLIFDVTEFVKNSDKKPLAAIVNKERPEWITLDQEFASTLQAIHAIDTGDLFISNASIDGRYWVIGFVHDTKSTQYYLFDTQTLTTDFLFTVRPELDNYQLAPMKPISFTSRDGLTIHGYLTCPVGIQHKNLPLILLVHGGPWQRDTWFLNAAVQWFANRGYACLQVNYRGSVGYGKTFLNAGNREWGAKMHDDLIDAVNWATAQGIADPQKIAIYGGSYGGYAALVGATFTPDVFCCAVDICGPCNLVSVLSSLPSYWLSDQKQWDSRVGNPQKDTDFLKSRSPLFKVDNIKIPILIGQGANDPRVKQAESEQIVAALKAKNLPYEYVLFPDEGHGFAKPENRLKFNAIAEKFLAQHLGGRYEA